MTCTAFPGTGTARLRGGGAGASALPKAEALPEHIDKETAKKYAGDKFDEGAFDAAAKDGAVPREEFLKAIEAARPARTGMWFVVSESALQGSTIQYEEKVDIYQEFFLSHPNCHGSAKGIVALKLTLEMVQARLSTLPQAWRVCCSRAL